MEDSQHEIIQNPVFVNCLSDGKGKSVKNEKNEKEKYLNKAHADFVQSTETPYFQTPKDSSKPSVKVSQEATHEKTDTKVRIREFDPFDPIYLKDLNSAKTSVLVPAQII